MKIHIRNVQNNFLYAHWVALQIMILLKRSVRFCYTHSGLIRESQNMLLMIGHGSLSLSREHVTLNYLPTFRPEYIFYQPFGSNYVCHLIAINK